MLIDILWISMAVGVISITVTKGTIFESFRKYLMQHFKWLGKLFDCHYCLSHWVSTLFVLFYKPLVISSDYIILDYITTIFCVIFFAMLFSFGTYRAYIYLWTKDDREYDKNELIKEKDDLYYKYTNLLENYKKLEQENDVLVRQIFTETQVTNYKLELEKTLK